MKAKILSSTSYFTIQYKKYQNITSMEQYLQIDKQNLFYKKIL